MSDAHALPVGDAMTAEESITLKRESPRSADQWSAMAADLERVVERIPRIVVDSAGVMATRRWIHEADRCKAAAKACRTSHRPRWSACVATIQRMQAWTAGIQESAE